MGRCTQQSCCNKYTEEKRGEFYDRIIRDNINSNSTIEKRVFVNKKDGSSYTGMMKLIIDDDNEEIWL